MSKRFLALFLSICLFVASFSVKVAATNTVQENVSKELIGSEILTRSGSSSTLTLTLQRMSANSGSLYIGGAFPTITITGSGNPNAKYKITVVDPWGFITTYPLMAADGSTISEKFKLSPSGYYQVHIQVYEGTTSGELVTFDITATW